MADTKITGLLSPQVTTNPATDVLPIVNIADTLMASSGSTRKITVNQLLGAGGTATLASATITGDLTVRTNKLSVTSTGVGCGTASPALPFVVSNAGAQGFEINPAGSIISGGIDILSYNRSTSLYKGAGFGAESYLFRVGTTSLSDAMTLNSTGLGVGASPANGRFIVGADATTDGNGSWNSTFRNTVGAATTAPKTGIAFSGYWNGTSNFANFSGITGGKENSTDANTAGLLTFWTSPNGGSPTTRMTIDSSGNVGVGVTPSASWVTYKALEFDTGIVSGSSSMALNRNCYFDGVNWRYKVTTSFGIAQYQLSGNGNHIWNIASSGSSGAAINGGTGAWTQAMTLDGSGNLLVGVTSPIASGTSIQNLGSARQVLTLKGNDQTSYTLGVWSAATTGDNLFSYFGTETSLSVRGSIDYNRAGGLVRYNTTSDYRAKDIIGPVSNSGSLIDSLKVYVGKMKGATIERPMLIAHEAQSVAPYAVTGTKDEVDADGNPKYQQMDVSALVPVLIAEIQSLRARVAALEA